MINNTLSKSESQKKMFEEKYEKTLAQINRIKAIKAELLRKNDNDIRMEQNVKLIEIGKIICASISEDPLKINLEEFQDFINRTWLTYHSAGKPLTQKEGFYYMSNNELWKKFKDENLKQYFIKKK